MSLAFSNCAVMMLKVNEGANGSKVLGVGSNADTDKEIISF
jgi:hypothetical protein